MTRAAILHTAVICLTAAILPHAHAADQLFSFVYDSPSNDVVITGELLGSLQADGNTVVVSQVLGVPAVNGLPAVSVPFVDSIINVVAGSSFLLPRVSLNGAVMDFAACTTNACDDGFGFEASGQFGAPLAALLPSFGGLDVIEYSPGDWTMSAVPEVDAWALMALGLVGIGLYRRVRQRSAGCAG